MGEGADAADDKQPRRQLVGPLPPGRVGRQMELLLRSMECHKPPFSRDGSPYESCAFDLSRDSDNKEHDAILFVDIHP
jgi:hypothetical protein